MLLPPRSERQTQQRVVSLFTDPHHPNWLGYSYLGDRSKLINSNVEVGLLTANLEQRGYTAAQISRAIEKLQRAAVVRDESLYNANKRVYQLLRFGIKVQVAAGLPNETVHLIDWTTVATNDFALAEEVTLVHGSERRIDLVVYLNGIAMAALELKRASVNIGDAVRQLVTNQDAAFNPDFFTTMQLLVAGSDNEGIRYGTVKTPEQFYTAWKPATRADPAVEGASLDLPLAELFDRDRLHDLLRYFILFDGGQKKVPRPHQYHGISAARQSIAKGEGGVIWHTQGSGKSIVMVLLARWILENYPDGRILVITDRDELDKQITSVMQEAGVVSTTAASPRIESRRELAIALSAPSPRLLCALVHKFDPDPDAPAPPVVGQFFVFVDECHRTQGGDMNAQMRAWLPKAVFVGFTGTPLLRRDRRTTMETFGDYIHTYKFDEAVADGVVLDLKYDSRRVEQRLTQVREVDDWFTQKTRGLNSYQQAVLRKRYATIEKLSSAQERKQRIVADIMHDFSVRPRLNNNRGTAILVAPSIYDACHYFRLFQNTDFADSCAIITSYEPAPGQISKESAGSDEFYKHQTYTKHVLPGHVSTKDYEDKAKEAFIKEPANMKLLIVVSKLLTGFDAPSCTYIYLDHELRDHNLFQAICRTNRLDGDDKDYGYIVDYKELFQQVEESIAVYTSDELDISAEGTDGNIKLKDWKEEGKRKLDEAREQIHYLCEPVPPPRTLEQYLHYFAGDAFDADELARTEQSRISYYKLTANYLRAYATLANDMIEAGYTYDLAATIKREIASYTDIREALKIRAGEVLDTRPFERDMRHLLNTYIQADPAQSTGQLAEYSLLNLIVETGINDAIAKQLNAKGNMSQRSIAETIVNNVRKVIIQKKLTDPRFYAEMSALLQDLIEQRRLISENYEEFLRLAEELIRKVRKGGSVGDVPESLRGTPRAVVVFNNLTSLPTSGTFVAPIDAEARAELSLKLEDAMRVGAPAGWKDEANGPKGSFVANVLHPLLNKDKLATQALFDLLRNQPDY